MKRIASLVFSALLLIGLLAGCKPESTAPIAEDGTSIALSDNGITVNGTAVTEDTNQAVYTAKDIVYYEDGKDFTYGEGTAEDAHTKEQADAHTVMHITKPGRYLLSGKLSKGQVAVDLGENAETNPEAVVTLVLNGVDITCEVAPAVIFYRVYECGTKDTETATKDVDTSAAGARVVIADGTENTVNGSYVARIYKPGTVELTEDGNEVADAKKLHKYDGAFYSKMSMVVQGEENDSGVLNIHAENEGLDSELHLSINGGTIHINSGNDGINTNEDGISVTTVNGGVLTVFANGGTGEGDGIDSNGWLVINGGSVFAQGCGISGDAGIDADNGIHIGGGTVFATGNMLDRIADSTQNHAVFTFASKQGEGVYTLKNADGKEILSQKVTNTFTYLVISSPDLAEGDYTLWQNETQMQGIKGTSGGGMQPGMTPPGGENDANRPEMPEGEPPEKPEGERPEMPEGQTPPDGQTPPEKPEGEQPKGEQPVIPEGVGMPEDNSQPVTGELSPIFTITAGANQFQAVSPVPAE